MRNKETVKCLVLVSSISVVNSLLESCFHYILNAIFPWKLHFYREHFKFLICFWHYIGWEGFDECCLFLVMSLRRPCNYISRPGIRRQFLIVRGI